MPSYKTMYLHLLDYIISAIASLEKSTEAAKLLEATLYDTIRAMEKAVKDVDDQYIKEESPSVALNTVPKVQPNTTE